ncbi:PREDICTED: betatrophin [Elephantulus edwardii]|uniref:betatrophin n=1 Tax=Elephantulus edwardii TaxID=28737 RepID=UPI0003F07A0D|nr:PREDICTED: betatrophin [Elephantulus edwardii]
MYCTRTARLRTEPWRLLRLRLFMLRGPSMMAMHALCLLWTLVAAARPLVAAPTGGPEPAQYEELTLLFHGALQLGQALNGVYKTTEARLTEAERSLGLYGHVLELLGQEVHQGRAEAQKLHTSLSQIQTEENVLEVQAEAMAQALEEVAQKQQELWGRLRQLEVRLRGAWLGPAHHEFKALKERADKQSYVVWALTGLIRRQQREMAAQQERLRSIQERLHTAALPA